MKMHFEEHRSAIVLRLEGECTHEDVDGFRRRCQEWLARGSGSYIIDGEAMERIDSAGLEAASLVCRGDSAWIGTTSHGSPQ